MAERRTPLHRTASQWIRPGNDLVQAYRLKPDGTRETIIKDDAGHAITVPAWIASLDALRVFIFNEEQMLYPENRPGPRKKTAARLRSGKKVRDRARRAACGSSVAGGSPEKETGLPIDPQTLPRHPVA